jgi:hypothetical protein
MAALLWPDGTREDTPDRLDGLGEETRDAAQAKGSPVAGLPRSPMAQRRQTITRIITTTTTLPEEGKEERTTQH